MTDWKRTKRAAKRFLVRFAVQGWLCVIFAVAGLLASLVGYLIT